MDIEGRRGAKKRRKRRLVAVVCCVVLVLLVVVVVLAVVLSNRSGPFKETFIEKCERVTAESKRPADCVKVWSAFERAYVGRDPCQVPVEAYDHLISTAPPHPACNRMMFWSGTKDVVHQASKGCYQTMEDSMLGAVLDGHTWCGKEGSNGKRLLLSFWGRASTEFAAVACGNTTVMLNGSRTTPFSPTSIFASIEVKKFTSDRMSSLTVVMVTNDNVLANCTDKSLKDLRKELAPGIKYICKEVTESDLFTCKNKPDKTCGPCW
ncbi:hypothetical protein NHX12_021773 [Muraenolepis orangiensis]|uniref:ADP-ribosyl cyclase/cyclic ADP-ribose hydrolase n=1 Tax=Muraenolepis orangiensis TaxID=630683 RepID=A0A9Q0EQP8_9TELE|nr:hypothetical protein NHX12_021773 [Muraenolepis orangiensis]